MAGKRTKLSAYTPKKRKGGDLNTPSQAALIDFKTRLHGFMGQKGWNQSELARHCEALLPKPVAGQKQNRSFGRDSISHYYRGVSLPRPERLDILAKALGVKPEDLIPAHGTALAGSSRPEFQITFMGEGQVFLSINKAMPAKLGLQIAQLVQADVK